MAPPGRVVDGPRRPKKGLLRRIRNEAALVPRWALYQLSRLWPRSAKRWVFGNYKGELEGNPKALFLWIGLNRPDIKAVWIADNRAVRDRLRGAGYRAHARHSPAGLLACIMSGVYVYAYDIETLNLPLSGGAFLLNLWHGIGLKGMKYGYVGGSQDRLTQQLARRGVARMRDAALLLPPDLIATTSPFMRTHFASQFRIAEERCPILGYSRLDYQSDPALLAEARRIDDRAFRLVEGGFDEVCVYLPTYRDSGRPFLQDALPDLAALSAALRRRNAVLYVKLHPRTRGGVPAGLDNIKPWPRDIDIYPVFERIDVLITDYSSILYDFIATKDRGVILYTFDLDEYMNRDRSLIYPFDENVAGLRVAGFEQLCDVLAEGRALTADQVREIAAVREKFWAGAHLPASRVIVEAALSRSTSRIVAKM